MDKLFEPFVTYRDTLHASDDPKGTGLGLCIAATWSAAWEAASLSNRWPAPAPRSMPDCPRLTICSRQPDAALPTVGFCRPVKLLVIDRIVKQRAPVELREVLQPVLLICWGKYYRLALMR